MVCETLRFCTLKMSFHDTYMVRNVTESVLQIRIVTVQSVKHDPDAGI
jgi:hypothetical protein